MRAYRIVNWWQYEVTDKGKQATAETPLDRLRKRPLLYVRKHTNGHNLTPAWRQLCQDAWSAVPGSLAELMCHGLFDKLLNLAASQDRQFRGWILDHKQRPMTVRAINDLLNLSSPGQVKKCLEILASQSICLVELAEFPQTPPVEGEKGGALSTSDQESGGCLYNVNESESKVKENKGPIGQKDSDLKSLDNYSGSDSTTPAAPVNYKTKMRLFVFDLNNAIRSKNKSDRTCFARIAEHLCGLAEQTDRPGVFAEAMEVAIDAAVQGADNPPAYFVNEMKKQFGFAPTPKNLMPGVFRP